MRIHLSVPTLHQSSIVILSVFSLVMAIEIVILTEVCSPQFMHVALPLPSVNKYLGVYVC